MRHPCLDLDLVAGHPAAAPNETIDHTAKIPVPFREVVPPRHPRLRLVVHVASTQSHDQDTKSS